MLDIKNVIPCKGLRVLRVKVGGLLRVKVRGLLRVKVRAWGFSHITGNGNAPLVCVDGSRMRHIVLFHV